MHKKYRNIEIYHPIELKDILIAMLSDLPFLGIIENEESIILSFVDEDFTEKIADELGSICKKLSNKIQISSPETIEEINWNEKWEQEVPSIKVSDKIGIAPEWKIDELDTPIKIIINPKMSFGTGDHDTTKLCIRFLEEIDLKDKTILDAGTGTGILSIVSSKLGAKKIMAFDNNEWSIRNAKENFAINDINNFELEMLELDEVNKLSNSDILVANILAHVIKRNIEKFAKSLNPKCLFIASGILIEQEDDIVNEAKKFDLKKISSKHLNEWTAIKFQKVWK